MMSFTRVSGVALLGLLGTLATLGTLPALAGCARKAEASTTSSIVPGVEQDESVAPSPWCGEGFRTVDESTCLAMPEKLTMPASVVVYVHGMMPSGALPTKEQATLAAAAQAHGFAVLFVHGKTGLCTWDASVADQICWPTKQETVDAEAPQILAGWREAQGHAEAMAGTRFEKRYVFGFSNGGYFVSYLTTEGLIPMDGAGVVGAGRTTIDETKLGRAHPPLYLAVGEEEAAFTRTDAANLSHVLTEHDWPVHMVVHPGRGHELHEDDLAAAWTAWGR